MTGRDELTNHVHTTLNQPGTNHWKAAQIVDWLWQHRITLCNHTPPAWTCERDCPAYQALHARTLRAERQENP